MLSIPQFAVLFFLLWVLLYVTVYNFLLSPTAWSKQQDSLEINKYLDKSVGEVERHSSLINVDPFVPALCTSIHESQSNARIAKKTVAVVIPARNEEKHDVFMTIESILLNSGSFLKYVVIVDDESTVPINSWKEWSTWRFAKVAKDLVGAVTLPKRLGVSGAKAIGAKLVIEKHKVDVVVFLDAHCVVSADWLAPLLQTLEHSPHALVYPVIDVLDSGLGAVIKADNVIGAFDWSLHFRWETPAASRTPLSANAREDDQTMSPAAPGIFAITSKFYAEIGGLHPQLKHWGLDSVELSIRVWLCGGEVIRQPCSRVAHQYKNLRESVAVGNGVTQATVDKNVMTVATQWLSPAQRETVFQSRFTGRVPYKVEVSLDAGQPQFLQGAPLVQRHVCQDFDWFLKEVYPGLTHDIAGVTARFRAHAASGFLEASLSPLLEQYAKKSAHAFDPKEISTIETDEKAAKELLRGEDESRRKSEGDLVGSKGKPKPKDKPLTPYEQHVQRVRDELVCEDFSGNDVVKCPSKSTDELCSSKPGWMMFACPKSCGLCGVDGLLCTDFFLKKCPEWKKEGQCDSNADYMNKNCRPTCGRCSLPDKGQELSKDPPIVQEAPGDKVAVVVPAVEAEAVAKLPASLVDSVEAKLPKADATLLQRLLLEGKLPDKPAKDPCLVKHRGNGQLLDRVKLDRSRDIAKSTGDTPSEGTPRIFCGIYTMESKHATNVMATRDTWGKRCSGFLAFSTATDPTLPSMLIPHEGPEDYNNMWQKSRSIWKYIGSHYMADFDWFLMGGDDMFYMIENLRDYLGSAEIRSKQSEGKGMFVGRRFFPPGQNVFNSGGAGYLLDRKALEVLMDNIDTPKCFPHQKGFWEDVNVASCLRVGGNILPYDTRDELKRERFHPFVPEQHLNYRIPPVHPDWYAQYNPELKIGFDCCSSQSISFHYCTDDIIRNLFSFVYYCDQKDPASV